MNESTTTARPVDSRRSVARWWALPAAVAIVAAGVWVTGGVLTNNETIAMGLTGLWLFLAGVVGVFIAWRRRVLAAPVLIGYAIAAVGIGGFLGYTSTVDQVVDEDVVVASSDSGAGAGASDEAGGAESGGTGNQLLAQGSFVADAHPTEGKASVIEAADGVVLTLTDFVTDPGPDLKVYLVPKGADVEDGLNLGSLKGNKGNQQYDVPQSFDTSTLTGASVVIWCRAFTVSFGSSVLS